MWKFFGMKLLFGEFVYQDIFATLPFCCSHLRIFLLFSEICPLLINVIHRTEQTKIQYD